MHPLYDGPHFFNKKYIPLPLDIFMEASQVKCGTLTYRAYPFCWNQSIHPSRHGLDFHRPQSQISIVAPYFHL